MHRLTASTLQTLSCLSVDSSENCCKLQASFDNCQIWVLFGQKRHRRCQSLQSLHDTPRNGIVATNAPQEFWNKDSSSKALISCAHELLPMVFTKVHWFQALLSSHQTIVLFFQHLPSHPDPQCLSSSLKFMILNHHSFHSWSLLCCQCQKIGWQAWLMIPSLIRWECRSPISLIHYQGRLPTQHLHQRSLKHLTNHPTDFHLSASTESFPSIPQVHLAQCSLFNRSSTAHSPPQPYFLTFSNWFDCYLCLQHLSISTLLFQLHWSNSLGLCHSFINLILINLDNGSLYFVQSCSKLALFNWPPLCDPFYHVYLLRMASLIHECAGPPTPAIDSSHLH